MQTEVERKRTVRARSPGKIVAVGELLIDLVPGKAGMRIADAGPVIKTASGSAGIFACAAARLGAESGFVGKVGCDSLSRMAVTVLEEQGVDLSCLVRAEEGQIGLAFLEYLEEGRRYQYYRKDSIGSKLRAEELDESYLASAFAVHFPGMLLELSEPMRAVCYKLVEVARRAHVLVSFDPNIRTELCAADGARERLLWAVRHADIVAPTLEEGRMITGKTEIGDVLRALHAMGPRVVALTRDKDGAILSMDGRVAVAEGIDEPPIDPTGAGDTFAAALCVGLCEGMGLEELAGFCNSAGTLVIRHRGAIGAALPTRQEVEALAHSPLCRVHSVNLDTL